MVASRFAGVITVGQQRHLVVTFMLRSKSGNRVGGMGETLTLHYRADECVAREFVQAVARYGGLVVEIDGSVTDTMRLLPCWRLFLP